MIIYNRHWIASLRICREAKRWRAAGIISEEQYGAIKTAHGTPLFVPALWIRIALFIFSSITLGAVIAAFPHWPGADGPIPDAILMAVIGLGTFVALEFLVKRMNLYQSGIEEAMLYNAQGRVIAGLMIVYGTLISGYPQPVVVFLIALPVCVWGAARYADRVATVAALVCIVGAVVSPLGDYGKELITLIPFVVLGISALMYVVARQSKKVPALRQYEDCFDVIEVAALVLFYAAGNYYVAHHVQALARSEEWTEDMEMPLGWIFVVLTVVTPLVYVLRGWFARDHASFRMGLIAACCSVLTFRVYFHVIPPETALVIAGAAFFVIAMIITRMLKLEPGGYTVRNLLGEKWQDLDAEAAVIGVTLGAPGHAQAAPRGFEGGGGQFGGGGASTDWGEGKN